MKILVACEESQRVTIEFRKLGHEAYSCDLIECSGGHPEWHIMGDVTQIINGWENNHSKLYIQSELGNIIKIPKKWDMIVAFPPCTYLSNAGAARLYPKKGQLNLDRYNKGLKAKEFFMKFYNANCDKIVIENPISTKIYNLPKYTQIIQPYEYGEPYSKKTCLWLKGVKKLKPTNIVTPICSWVSGGSKDNNGNTRKNKGMTFRDAKTKSKTFEGIAKAMAEQWGNNIIVNNED